MQILTQQQHQVLGFIDACNHNHYKPTDDEVLGWLDSPAPRQARYERRRRAGRNPYLDDLASRGGVLGSSLLDSPAMREASQRIVASTSALFAQLHLAGNTESVLVEDGESQIDHLLRIGWLASDASLRLTVTQLGAALLRGAERGDQDDDLAVVVLGRDDPLAYATLVGNLADAGEGMLVDPYLGAQELLELVELTTLTRYLVMSSRHKGQRDRAHAALSAYLRGAELVRPIEVRHSPDLHDRVVIASNGHVHTLGTSLNGVTKSLTVYSPMPDVAAIAIAAHYEKLWDSATLLGRPIDHPAGEDPPSDPDSGN